MSKPQFVLEESLEGYLDRLARSWSNHEKVIDSIIDFNIGLLVGLKAARGKILKEKVDDDPR